MLLSFNCFTKNLKECETLLDDLLKKHRKLVPYKLVVGWFSVDLTGYPPQSTLFAQNLPSILPKNLLVAGWDTKLPVDKKKPLLFTNKVGKSVILCQ